jgi:hypothetical protein
MGVSTLVLMLEIAIFYIAAYAYPVDSGGLKGI